MKTHKDVSFEEEDTVISLTHFGNPLEYIRVYGSYMLAKKPDQTMVLDTLQTWINEERKRLGQKADLYSCSVCENHTCECSIEVPKGTQVPRCWAKIEEV